VERLLLVDEEFRRKGTVFGSPLCPTEMGYNEDKLKEFSALIKEYRKHWTRLLMAAHILIQRTEEALISEGKIDALNTPTSYELKDWLGEGGIIERAFGDERRERLTRLDDFVSLSPEIDNVEKFGHKFIVRACVLCAYYILRVSFTSESYSN
jgi:hypothetical protein